MQTLTQNKEGHAVRNCKAHLNSIVTYYNAYNFLSNVECLGGSDDFQNAVKRLYSDKPCMTELINDYCQDEYTGLNELDSDFIIDRVNETPLSLEVKADDWQSLEDSRDIEPTKGRLLLSTGGPAAQIIGDIEGDYMANVEIQFQDWLKPWESIRTNSEQFDALKWFVDLFCWYNY